MSLTRRQFLARMMESAAGVIALSNLGVWDETKVLRGWEDLSEETGDARSVSGPIRETMWHRATAPRAKKDTVLAFDSCGMIQAGDMLIVPRTGEFLRVVGVRSTGRDFDVVRGVSGSSAYAIMDGDWTFRPF